MKPIQAYKAQNDVDTEQLLAEHTPLVKRIAYHLKGRLPVTVQIDDLIQSGMIGLLEAARKYDGTFGASFQTYAGIRIRGAMIDEVRKNGWAPRSVHRKAREASQAMQEISAKAGRDGTDTEVAQAMGVTLEEYRKILKDASHHKLISMSEDDGAVLQVEADANETNDPYEGVQFQKYREALGDAIEMLPEREQLVMALYYDKQLNMREIGEILEVSESRVCQIHSQAIIRLQSKLSSWTS